MKTSQVFRIKRRGVTPVIATVLLIGLVVIAGIGVALVMFGTINTPDPISVEIVSISDFKTTDNDILIDSFSVTLHNEERTNVRIQADAFVLLNGTDEDDDIVGWSMNLDQNEIILPALAIQTIPLSCDPIDEQLSPKNDTIYIEVTVFPEGSTRNERTFRSNLLIIGDTSGPVYLDSPASNLILTSEGLNLSFNAANFGSTDRNLFLEFSTDSPDKIYFVINENNATRLYFSISRYSNTTFTDDVFTIKPKLANISHNDRIFIFIWSWDQEKSMQLSIATILLTYQT
ncbi:MAG: archaellin/type IV pilin N-terminal domain-containing protein [Candidatus Hodarchaeota archaeon]